MGSLVVIGNFDGVHRGHRAVLEGAAGEAERMGLVPKLLTFHPHPAVTLGRTPPPLLTHQRRKRELIGEIAPTIELCETVFDTAFAAQSPAQFARWLVDTLAAQQVVVGDNFRFGKARQGDFARLVELGTELGFGARSEPLRGDALGGWSSTRARKAILAGDLHEATNVLGRPHMLTGRVAHGKALGRTIGVPTANLGDVVEALPALGVYATRVEVEREHGPVELGYAATSVGLNPTTDQDGRVKVEAFILDFDGDLYGQPLRVHLLERLRGEQRFDSVAELKRQIDEDVAATRRVAAARRG